MPVSITPVRCSHCERPMTWAETEDSRDAEARYLCAACLDLSVWGAACGMCGRIPLTSRVSCRMAQEHPEG